MAENLSKLQWHFIAITGKCTDALSYVCEEEEEFFEEEKNWVERNWILMTDL